MREMVRYGFILGLICIVASASLAVVNAITRPRILAQAQTEEESSLREVMPEGERFEPVKSGADIIYYKAYNKKNSFIGIAFKADAKGYSSTVESMAGLKRDGTITSIKILSQNETPGLGTRITEPNFLKQFFNKNTKDLKEVQAIAGATISSRAVINSVTKKAEELKELIRREPR